MAILTVSTSDKQEYTAMSGIPRIKINNYTFYYQYEFSLLDALEAQEIEAPYSCRGGYCGCCKVRLLEGEVEQVQDALFDVGPEEILACCAVPKTHIEIEIPDK
ncbi:MAG: 2Fe-2S iron-sulfur cluster-binding protein [Pontibacterium sp.]